LFILLSTKYPTISKKIQIPGNVHGKNPNGYPSVDFYGFLGFRPVKNS